MTMKQPQALAAIITANLLWGGSYYLGKVALRELPVSHVVFFRFAIAAVAMLPLIIRHPLPKSRDFPLLAATGLTAVPLTFMLQFGGLSRTSSAAAAIITGSLPGMLALTGVLFLKERLSGTQTATIFASTAGVALIAGSPAAGNDWLGDAMIFGSLFVVIVWILLTRRLQHRLPPTVATAWVLLLGAASQLPFAVVADGFPSLSLSPVVWLALAGSGLGCSAGAFSLWNWGLMHVPVSRAGIYTNLEPFFGVVLGVTLLHETLGAMAGAGAVLILVPSIIVTAVARKPDRREIANSSREEILCPSPGL